METLDFNRVLEERQNFDPAGHYSRPDVTRLLVNRERQTAVRYEGGASREIFSKLESFQAGYFLNTFNTAKWLFEVRISMK